MFCAKLFVGVCTGLADKDMPLPAGGKLSNELFFAGLSGWVFFSVSIFLLKYIILLFVKSSKGPKIPKFSVINLRSWQVSKSMVLKSIFLKKSSKNLLYSSLPIF